jgi:hypothetical protein
LISVEVETVEKGGRIGTIEHRQPKKLPCNEESKGAHVRQSLRAPQLGIHSSAFGLK